MRFLITLSILSCILLFSCQKESGFSINNNTSGGGGGTSGLLVRLVSKSGSDSAILTFGYNSSSKLITFDWSDPNVIVRERVERNSQGIIQKIFLKSNSSQQAGFDSAITKVGYNSGRYTYKETTFDYRVPVTKDSIAFIYDGTGKVVTEKAYVAYVVNGFDSSYKEYRKVDYTYTGNNIATIKYYNYVAVTSSYSLQITYTYDQYDNKISPMYFGIEALVFGLQPFISLNNPTKSTITSAGSPADNYTTTYTYNSSNKPLTALSTIQPGNTTVAGKYYYQ